MKRKAEVPPTHRIRRGKKNGDERRAKALNSVKPTAVFRLKEV